jgi:fatty-acyl-CoA synthase
MDISGWIERWADFAPDKSAILFDGEDLSYRRFRDRIREFARMLAGSVGVRRGDRVAFLGYNSADFLVLMFACARLGAIFVPLNWRLAPEEHAYILTNAGASVLFVEPEFEVGVGEIRAQLGECRLARYGEAADGWDSFEALLAAADAPDRDPGAGPDDPALIVYTSGTTGRPKGAVLTQRALTFNAVNGTAAYDITSSDVVFTNLPMFHVGGLNIHTTPSLHAGASVILHRRFEPDPTVAAIRDHRPSLMILVPAMMQALIDHPSWPEIDFSCLRCIVTGSTTVPEPILRTYLDREVSVIQVYGSTETAPIVVHQRISDAYSTVGSTGKTALHCEAEIRDADGKRLPPGENGEIVVRGPNIMTEYWDDPDATAEVLRDGWFHTGDVGHTDGDGNFYVVDRTKDVIISGSENIYPAEVEIPLDECPDIVEAAVVARPDPRWGEVPVACVVRRDGSAITKDDVLALYRGRLARYKHPHDVIFMSALPRNVMGKILKFELRASIAP